MLLLLLLLLAATAAAAVAAGQLAMQFNQPLLQRRGCELPAAAAALAALLLLQQFSSSSSELIEAVQQGQLGTRRTPRVTAAGVLQGLLLQRAKIGTSSTSCVGKIGSIHAHDKNPSLGPKLLLLLSLHHLVAPFVPTCRARQASSRGTTPPAAASDSSNHSGSGGWVCWCC